MFLTNDANKHPLSSAYGKGNHVWIATEVQLRLPIFMVEFAHHEVDDDGDDFSLLRTLLLARGDDVLNLVSDLAPQKALKSVALLTPASGDLGRAWSIDQLTAIWEAEDPGDSHIKLKVFSKADGSYYVDSMSEIATSQLRDWHQLFELPAVQSQQ
ncbi:hypothetical protein [Comamonas sp. UBA7528]|uniref:hypothetical protein n=1 Tax=Comamonas sp. UBA7528 TaxID=1946391 RepID=UPI0025B7D0CF|nr:hypothetical protein [Comamonas sp. UBA7528]